MQKQLRLAGTGGQGQVLAGIILADAAVAYDAKYATQSQSYGPESRGGASRAEVVISDEPVDYPKVIEADLLLCMSQEAYDKYGADTADDGIILIDSTLVQVNPNSDSRIVARPITRVAREELGRAIVANVVALGVIIELTKAVSPEAARKAVSARVPPGTEEANLQALERGRRLARENPDSAQSECGASGVT